MKNTYLKTFLAIVLISVLPILLVYAPFIAKVSNVWGIPLKTSGLQMVFANWDGPNFVINALAGYNMQETAKIAIAGKNPAYYSAHLPGYSALIALFGLMGGVYFGSFIVNILSNIVLNLTFYQWIKHKVAHPLYLTFIFTIFPARFLTIRSVISNEMLAIALLIFALILWEKKRFVLSGLLIGVGIWFKLQMAIIPIAFIASLGEEFYKTRKLPVQKVLSIALCALFGIALGLFYKLKTGRFDAFIVGQNISGLSMGLPFSMFNGANLWVSTAMTEHLVLYLFALVFLCISLFQAKEKVYFWIATCYTLFLTFIPHIDIPRYALLIYPLFLLAVHSFFENRKVRLAILIILPAIYLSTINFIASNQAPIIDWSIFR